MKLPFSNKTKPVTNRRFYDYLYLIASHPAFIIVTSIAGILSLLPFEGITIEFPRWGGQKISVVTFLVVSIIVLFRIAWLIMNAIIDSRFYAPFVSNFLSYTTRTANMRTIHLSKIDKEVDEAEHSKASEYLCVYF